jgi:hypothetical protein
MVLTKPVRAATMLTNGNREGGLSATLPMDNSSASRPSTPSETMYLISFATIIFALFIGVFATIFYFDKKEREMLKTFIGVCVAMPPLEDVRVLGLNALPTGGRHRSYFFRISQTDNGTVSEVDEPVGHIVGKPVVPCAD